MGNCCDYDWQSSYRKQCPEGIFVFTVFMYVRVDIEASEKYYYSIYNTVVEQEVK